MRRLLVPCVAAATTLVACGDDRPGFETLLDVGGAVPGDVIALRGDGASVEYVHRRDGTIHRVTDSPGGSGPAVELLATIAVSTEGEQRGLLGHTTIGDRRFAAWTEPDTLDLVVGELVDGRVDRLVWAGTTTSSKAVGGHLESFDGRLLLGIGSLTGWAREHGSGALVLLDPDGPPGQEPTVQSDGWNNPFAFTVTEAGDVWVADNAPDGSDLPVAERDGEAISSPMSRVVGLIEPPPQRAPSAFVELPDGRLGVCGFLDGELRAYSVGDDDRLTRAGTIGPCRTGAAVLADGSIVTSSTSESGPALLIRRPS